MSLRRPKLSTTKGSSVPEEEEDKNQELKDGLKKDYTRRLKMILKAEQNVKNKITANEALAVPVLRNSFGIINCRKEEIRQTGRNIRKILTTYKMHHPKTDIDRLYGKKE